MGSAELSHATINICLTLLSLFFLWLAIQGNMEHFSASGLSCLRPPCCPQLLWPLLFILTAVCFIPPCFSSLFRSLWNLTPAISMESNDFHFPSSWACTQSSKVSPRQKLHPPQVLRLRISRIPGSLQPCCQEAGSGLATSGCQHFRPQWWDR